MDVAVVFALSVATRSLAERPEWVVAPSLVSTGAPVGTAAGGRGVTKTSSRLPVGLPTVPGFGTCAGLVCGVST